MADRPILLSSPDVGAAEEAAIVAALRSGWVAPLGPDVEAFEAAIARRTTREYAIALSSGTAALHLGLLTLGACPGDVVVTSTLTFAATANAIVYTGAEPYFVDVDPITGNLDPDLLDEALNALDRSGRRVAAVVPVDLLGKTADYARIVAVAERWEVPVLADAAESLGARSGDRPAGASGEAAAFSFNGNKIMTTSGGGMLVTDDGALAARVRHLATQAREPVAHYEHREIGYNYRLSNILAALGRAQLDRLDEMMRRRRLLRERYRSIFREVDVVSVFGGDEDRDDNCWLTAVLVEETASWRPRDLSAALSKAGIESRPLWKPMHLQPVFADAPGLITGTAEGLFNRGLTLPSGSVLTADDHDRIDVTLREFLEQRA